MRLRYLPAALGPVLFGLLLLVIFVGVVNLSGGGVGTYRVVVLTVWGANDTVTKDFFVTDQPVSDFKVQNAFQVVMPMKFDTRGEAEDSAKRFVRSYIPVRKTFLFLDHRPVP